MADRFERLRDAIALDRGGITEGDLAAALDRGDMQLWTTPGSALISERVYWRRKSGLHIPFAGGDMGELIGLTDQLAAVAVAGGLDRLTLAGRKGWERVPALRERGWTLDHIVMARELD